MNRQWLCFALMSLASLLNCTSNKSTPPCLEAVDTEALHQRLAEATPGQCVALTGTLYVGSFQVRPGVTIQGQGAQLVGFLPANKDSGGSHVGNPPQPCVVCLDSRQGAGTTRLVNATIDNDGVGVLARGNGEVALEAVTVRVDRGAGMVSEAAGLTLQTVSLTGPAVDEQRLGELGDDISPDRTAIVGLLVVGGRINLSNVDIEGFAGFGGLLFEVEGVWRGGSVSHNVGTGVLVERGAVSMVSVEVERTRRTFHFSPLVFPVGLVASQGAALQTQDMTLQRNDGVGFLQDGAQSTHIDLQVSNNGDFGVWVQQSEAQGDIPALSLTGEGSLITNNTGAGIYLRDVSGIVLADAEISGTTLLETTDEILGDLSFGDGVQLSGASRGATLSGLTLLDNARVGLLLDGLNTDAGNVSLEAVSIVQNIDGEPLGLRAQNFEMLDTAGVSVEPEAVVQRDAQAAAEARILSLTPLLERIPEASIVGQGPLVGDGGLISDDGIFVEGINVSEDGLGL